ncbi:MAG: DUF2007 domain-containing protein [Flavobacteriales bacterium]|nr:DUF2007 domain-containing protein [Flavobacteriales bacterium]MBK7240609.1 DUF2007 domain-containing protein [Flavobacteriales bacterium]MBK7297290.1 DUF2007 domain-containing protein [Flavobacteriales bacterium]MBK9535959.1 DUF2007 domain-containing protein [Flavobacteriales bacterium]MBP9138865.1 DUF2007 domain-containing protein [Flavobacteriales bacterium]
MKRDLVTIRFYDDPIEAHLARCILENAGIGAYVNDEHTISLNRLWGYALGGVKLKVSTSDRESAILLLSESESLPYLDENEAEMKCPRCGSADLTSGVSRPRDWKSIGHLLVSFIFITYPLGFQRGMSCGQCGHFFDMNEQ